VGKSEFQFVKIVQLIALSQTIGCDVQEEECAAQRKYQVITELDTRVVICHMDHVSLVLEPNTPGDTARGSSWDLGNEDTEPNSRRHGSCPHGTSVGEA